MKFHSIAPKPSYVSLPYDLTYKTILEFILDRFPHISKEDWVDRVMQGKVHFENGELVRLDTPYVSNQRICYYREVSNEHNIPFKEKIIFENENFIIVDKPHFLPVHPAGRFVNETVVSRLMRRSIEYHDLCPAHRLDRLTAGLVLCIKKRELRGIYQKMFMNNEISKSYIAIANLPKYETRKWHIKNRLETHDEHFRMCISKRGLPNSESIIELVETTNDIGLFKLWAITGKKHQLRVHMASIGAGILNDPLYPNLSALENKDNYNRPLQLLAKELRFTDPVTGKEMDFRSRLVLKEHFNLLSCLDNQA